MTASTERPHVKAIRHLIKRWPLPRGKGLLLKAAAPLLKGDVIFEALPGVVVKGPLSDFTFLWHFTCLFDSERPLLFALETARPGNLILDVGTNFGLWSLGLGRKVGQQGRVYAFDPLPLNVRHIEDNLRLNGLRNVEVIPAAVSNAEAEVSFSVAPESNSAVGRIGGSGDVITVPAITLDGFCASRGIERVHLLKIDVEGAETLVLRGARKLLTADRAPVLIFELDPELPSAHGASPEEVLEMVRSFGYSTYIISKGGVFAPVPSPLSEQVDVIAFKSYHTEAERGGRKWWGKKIVETPPPGERLV